MGLLRNLLLQDEIKEKKRQFDERMKLENAKLLVEQDKTKQAFKEFMQGTSEKYVNISPTVTSPEGERVQHPLLKETGIQPDYSRAIFGEGQPQVPVPAPLFEKYYENLQKARQGAVKHDYRMEEKKTPSGTTEQPKAEQIPAFDSNTGKQIMVDINNPNLKWNQDKNRYEFSAGKVVIGDYGQALNSATYEYALKGFGKKGEVINRVDLHNMAKELQAGTMQPSQEADVLKQLDSAKKKNKKLKIDWQGMATKYPDLDIAKIQIGYKSLGY